MTAKQQALFGAAQTQKTSDDYYTPRWIFDRIGLGYELDVAAPQGGIEWIPARRYFTKEDDGLAQDWTGRVWMNPPYSKPAPWVERWLEHGDGIALLPTSKSRWFDRLWSTDAGLVMLPADLTFVGGKILMPTALVAIGRENIAAIGNVGRVR